MADKQIPLDIDRLALMIGRLHIENLGLAQQLEAARADHLAQASAATEPPPGSGTDSPA